MNLFPKNASSDSLRPSSIVMYENDGTPILACIIEFKKNKYLLLNQRERDIELSPDRLYALEIDLPSDINSRAQKAAYLNALCDSAQKKASSISIPEIWSLLSQESRDFGCREIVSNYFGNVTSENHLAFRYALLSDKIYFKRKKEYFSPRPPAVVEDLKKAEEERQRKLELQELSYSFFEAKRKNPHTEIPAQLYPIIELLEDVASENQTIDDKRQREARDFLAAYSQKFAVELGGRHHERAFNFLRLVNYYDDYSNLVFAKHRPPLQFSDKAKNEAQGLSTSADTTREDLTHLETFTVDDNSTRDMDDAISIEFLPNGYRLGIHISDVASFILPNSALEAEAAERATSIYLSDQVIHMLPSAISQDKLSLLKGETRPALSYLFDVDKQFNITEKKIVSSLIRVQHRYNYEEASDFLEHGGRDWEVLHAIAAASELIRIGNGAVKINKRDAQVIIDDKRKLTLQEIDEDTPGRALISELMILANQYSADFARQHRIPIVYRGQEKANNDNSQHLARIPEGPARDFNIRITLKKSLTTLAPNPHASLGLSAYCQATSPIRRYIDLCNQRQLISYIRDGKCAYDQDQLYKILTSTDEHLNRATLITRESKRFWLLKYLEQNYLRKEPLSATLVKSDGKNTLVELDVIYITVPVKLIASYPLGQKVKLKVAAVDPVFDYLKLEEVK